MKYLFLCLLAAGLVGAGCATDRAQNRGTPSAVSPSTQSFAFAPTQPTDGAFEYAQVRPNGVFDWRTLSVRFHNKTYMDGNALAFVIDMDVANGAKRSFPWEDYAIYLGLPDARGDWDYRLLFTRSKITKINGNGKLALRYYTQFPGMSVPDRYVIVVQSMFGGRDAGFSFAREWKTLAVTPR